MNIETVITSAAVATLVSAALTLLGQALERSARRKELLLAKAVEIAVERARFGLEIVKDTRQPAEFIDPAINAATYYKWLRHLLDKGQLPPDAKELRPGERPEGR